MGENEVPAEGRFASTWHNRAAARALRAARLSMGDGDATQADFAARLSPGLGTELSASALSNYESGRRGVPTAVLIEASLVAGKSIDGLLAKSGEPRLHAETEGPPGGDGDTTELFRKVEAHDQRLVALKREIQDTARLLARMRHRLEEAGITLAEASAEDERQDARAM